mmetsp:Transcript_5780/g.9906  ORF Transcript_5780/g.9906 Transcript_5780/m.9906 type:complete len:107 (-) Transcript_5780:66-386(-)
MEAKHYPIFASMWHPEYQVLDQIGPEHWQLVGDRDTDEIAFRLSLLLNRYARMNSNKIDDKNAMYFENKLSVNRHPSQPYQLISKNYILAYGYLKHDPIPKPQRRV